MPVEIECRPYGPDCTPEELEAIRARVSWFEDGIIVLRETPIQTPFSTKCIFKRIRELVGDKPFLLLIDLCEAKRPSAEVRHVLSTEFARLSGVQRVAVFMELNLILRAAARFVLSGMMQGATFHKTEKEALEKLRHGSY